MIDDERRFTLTEEHVKLLRAAYVGWSHVEWGAPEIDPKRPYGNGDYIKDIYYLLATEDSVAFTWDSDYGLPSGLSPAEWGLFKTRARQLHLETETALQIVLATGGFEPGEYVAKRYGKDWRRADG